ncbi:pyruvate dehydrogenase complex dihydrolipoamide acetyltransferase [Acetobacter oeni]|uniref:Acetyltransferase component of pyruvate dehydrogenase complex n=1 Tax=Acetobacter oeni TaxID=304077 RepID=A0A511XII0_9PROT|nr:pyruvate dehydrogenase complex dihydrolipoamide acetyltransferase [Acetobacter oeni]MBB3881471.1 pyruvate dehydrogenase E2 component (dihydrolipoamide acetyltransferase) [Acetobacter oeni]NHO18336.1 pyruvate dehydrogenase complex dihydrolipoamide acetyltransferase [Acetobacter oeni]GBR10880.1 dihydrolipoamide acetyltransferase component [Acetobacter oeni LMG 21952]GEN62749.1 acetyltransferase component of pyruvate dehydrogenase complex [Acetobacter oeni]
MATDILMPALSPTMTEGKLARWLKKEGETISPGQVIAEIETDKATMEVEAVEEGILGKIFIPEGTEGVAVNTPIAVLIEEGEAVPEQAPAPKTAPVRQPEATAATPKTAAAPQKMAPASTPQPVATPTGRIVASPLAKRIAKEAGLDLSGIKGSGPNGRIVKRDVENAKTRGPAKPAATAVLPAEAETVPMSSMRKVIARRLTEAKTTIPHFYVSVDVQLDALLSLRQQLNAASPPEGDDAFKLSVNDMLIKATALTLRRVPDMNVSYAPDAIVHYPNVDISVAVSIPDGLITPIIRNADKKSLREISNETKDLVARARAGKLKPEEFQGGSFSISNMGMFGISAFSAIINPPQAGILAIAAGEKRPVVKGDSLAIGTVMTATISVDHRVVDGALAAQWMSVFRSVVENPISLVV